MGGLILYGLLSCCVAGLSLDTMGWGTAMPTSEVGALARRLVPLVAAVAGSAAALMQLAGGFGLPGRLILIAVAITALFYLVVRFWLLHYVQKIRQLRSQLAQLDSQLATMQVGHQRYVDAIDRIVDQEGPIYAEHLELTVVVGADDASDSIVERRRTAPMPRITNRAIRPIMPTDLDRHVALGDLDLRCELEHPIGSVKALPLADARNPRIWLIFEPGMTEPFTWEVSYRPRGLWRPLRKQGFDYLVWVDRLPAGRGGNSVLTELVVTFVFPATGSTPKVVERHGHGNIQEAKLSYDDGQWLVVWRDPAPAGRRYEWDVVQQSAGDVVS